MSLKKKKNDTLYRIATEKDVLSIMRLYQLVSTSRGYDALFSDYKALRRSIVVHDDIWMVAEQDGRMVAFTWLNIDEEHRLGKLKKMYFAPGIKDSKTISINFAPHIVDHIANRKTIAEVIYTTTSNVNANLIQLLRESHFKMLGIHPNASPGDLFRIGEVSALFFGNSLGKKRF
ncbi:MAG: hypothetical protein HY537_16665, partial [Deltaproteobacteria bacterium]|nr:hypothetical protein [Deltaproteobacteria bacterium]